MRIPKTSQSKKENLFRKLYNYLKQKKLKREALGTNKTKFQKECRNFFILEAINSTIELLMILPVFLFLLMLLFIFVIIPLYFLLKSFFNF